MKSWHEVPVGPAVATVHYLDSRGRPLNREANEGFEVYHEWLEHDRQVNQWMIYHFGMEKDVSFMAQETAARQFWHDLGFTNLPQVYLLREDPEDRYKFWGKPTVIAHNDPDFNMIFVRAIRMEELQSHDENLVARTLVHEFAHATQQFEDFYLRLNDDDYPGYFARAGFNMHVKHAHEGSFFEEGFAEYISSCYRRSLGGDHNAIGIDRLPSLELPDYMQPPDAAMVSGPEAYAMELIAYGLERRELLSAEDFKQLLLDTRKRETRTEALRAFAYLVEKLEPGLYAKLRKLEYGKANWQEALRWVHNVVVKSSSEIDILL